MSKILEVMASLPKGTVAKAYRRLCWKLAAIFSNRMIL
jgi:hypothetical protein